MNNSFSLQQIQKTSNLDANLVSRQYKLNLMAEIMRVKNENSKKKQSEIANQLGICSSTIQRLKNDKKMLSPYRISKNNTKKQSKKALNTDFKNNSHHKADDKRPQMTSKQIKQNQIRKTNIF